MQALPSAPVYPALHVHPVSGPVAAPAVSVNVGHATHWSPTAASVGRYLPPTQSTQ